MLSLSILQYVYLGLSFIGFNVNSFVIYCILLKINFKFTSGDVFILSLSFNNIFLLFFFIIQIFIPFQFISYIISFSIVFSSLISFYIGLRSYNKVVLHQDIKNEKAVKYIIISLVVNIIGVLGFGVVSNSNNLVFNFTSVIILIWVMPIMTMTYFFTMWFYYEIYTTRNKVQNTVKEMTSPRKLFVEEKKEEKKEVDNKKLKIKTLSSVINRKLSKNIFSYLSIFSLQWIVTIVIVVISLILSSVLSYLLNVIWILIILVNTILTSIIYGFANNKVREWFSRKPGKIRILINRLTEKKIKVTKYEDEINTKKLTNDVVPTTPRIDSACGVHIIDMRGDISKEYNSPTPLQEVSFNPSLSINPDLSPPSSIPNSVESTPEKSNEKSNDGLPELHSPNSRERIMSFKNLNKNKQKIRPSKKEEQNMEERFSNKRQISPNTSYSPTDLRAIRVKNLMISSGHSLEIPQKHHKILTIGIPGVVNDKEFEQYIEMMRNEKD